MNTTELTLLATAVVSVATLWLIEGFLLLFGFLVDTGRLDLERMELIVRQFAASSAVVMVASSAYLYAQSVGADVHHDQVTFGLPVFVGSLIAVAGFVWAVARWDAKRELKVDRIENKLDALLAEREQHHKENP